jgi:hypothetical protein
MWFGRTVIRSIHELNYELAQHILNDEKVSCVLVFYYFPMWILLPSSHS